MSFMFYKTNRQYLKKLMVVKTIIIQFNLIQFNLFFFIHLLLDYAFNNI